MRRLLDERREGTAVTESELERRFLELLERNRLPRPVLQYQAPWLEHAAGKVDAAFPDRRVVVELDGHRWHSRDAERERDLRRDHAAVAAGWSIVRFSWRQVSFDEAYVVRILTHLLLLDAA